MFHNKWKTEILTIPNLLSLFRMALIPVYVHLYRNAMEPYQFRVAGLILAVSCLTDAVDGKIARRFHMVSTLGKILDPIADKATQLALILCLALKYPVLNFVLGLFAFKEMFQITLGIFHLRRGRMLPGALPAGKVCTAVLFTSLTLLVFFPDMTSSAVRAIALTDAVFLGISLISYYSAYFGPEIKLRNIDTA